MARHLKMTILVTVLGLWLLPALATAETCTCFTWDKLLSLYGNFIYGQHDEVNHCISSTDDQNETRYTARHTEKRELSFEIWAEYNGLQYSCGSRIFPKPIDYPSFEWEHEINKGSYESCREMIRLLISKNCTPTIPPTLVNFP